MAPGCIVTGMMIPRDGQDLAPRERWNARYETGDLPWDTGRHDRDLAAVVADTPVRPCRALEVGCGTGTNAIWLAARGFDVTAVDVSSTAVAQATEKAAKAGITVQFAEVDVVHGGLPDGPFGFVFDRGCFHSVDGPAERTAFARQVADCLESGGLWFSMIGSTDAPPRETGPPQLSAAEIAEAVEPLFEIRSLTASHFDSEQPNPAPAWLCLLRKRTPESK